MPVAAVVPKAAPAHPKAEMKKKMIKIFQYLITLDENDEMRTIDNSQIYLGIMCPSEKAFCIGVEHGMV